jgi:hypothetical protein
LISFIPSFSFHDFTSIRGFCFRSRSNPFPANLIDFWDTFGTPAVTNRTVGPHGPSEVRPSPLPLQSTFSSVEREVIAALAHAPGRLDFYVWLVWKSWTLNGPAVQVPLFGDSGLTAQLGSTNYAARRRFRQIIAEWIVKVRTLWPECPAEISPGGNRLLVRSSKCRPAVTTVSKGDSAPTQHLTPRPPSHPSNL